MCLLQVIWHYVTIMGLYFFAPDNWHYLYFDHVILRLPVYVFVGLPALATCVLTIATFLRLREEPRMAAIVVVTITSFMAVCYLVWLFWILVVSPADPRGIGFERSTG